MDEPFNGLANARRQRRSGRALGLCRGNLGADFVGIRLRVAKGFDAVEPLVDGRDFRGITARQVEVRFEQDTQHTVEIAGVWYWLVRLTDRRRNGAAARIRRGAGLFSVVGQSVLGVASDNKPSTVFAAASRLVSGGT